MKRVKILFIIISFFSFHAQAQNGLTNTDKSALEGIIVEKYFIADSSDYNDTLNPLPKGTITYRIYVDMKPDYTLQLVYGNEKHPLTIQTSTQFYNNADCGALIGYNVNYLKVNRSTFALDSWLTINSASNQYAGILKSEDADGSVLNRHSLNKTDGFTQGNLPVIKPFNIDLNFFNNDTNASLFSTNNGGWAAITGVKSGSKGPTVENRVLIAQLTTDGKLSFDLNIQIGTPSGGAVQFVSKHAEGAEIKFDQLSFTTK